MGRSDSGLAATAGQLTGISWTCGYLAFAVTWGERKRTFATDLGHRHGDEKLELMAPWDRQPPASPHEVLWPCPKVSYSDTSAIPSNNVRGLTGSPQVCNRSPTAVNGAVGTCGELGV